MTTPKRQTDQPETAEPSRDDGSGTDGAAATQGGRRAGAERHSQGAGSAAAAPTPTPTQPPTPKGPAAAPASRPAATPAAAAGSKAESVPGSAPMPEVPSAPAVRGPAPAELPPPERLGQSADAGPSAGKAPVWKQAAPKLAVAARKTSAAVRDGFETLRQRVKRMRDAEEAGGTEAAVSESEMEQKAREIRERVVGSVGERMGRTLDDETQAELGRLLTILPRLSAGDVVEREQFILVLLDCLLGDEPKLVLARTMRNELERQSQYRSGLLSRNIHRIAGDTSLGCLLFSIVAFLFAYVLFMWAASPTMYRYGAFFGHDYLFISLTSAAMIGGVISILSRLRDFADLPVFNPLLVFCTAFFKPFIAMAFAYLIFSILNSGLIGIAGFDQVVEGFDKNTTAAMSVIWVIGFFSGFSERFVKDFVGSMEDRLSPASASAQPDASADAAAAPSAVPTATRSTTAAG